MALTKHYWLYILFSAISLPVRSQLSGIVLNTNHEPIPYSTIALLNADDSTLQSFAIAAVDGYFNISNIKPGNILLQVSCLGYKTLYKKINYLPDLENDTIILNRNDKTIKEIEVSTDKIPIRIKQDTVEYDAGAYKIKPDAVAEDLLKKLPGVEVDKNGNIKAQGENVLNVLVNGKEFFSNDPLVATKNLPADALEKVQVYDKKSEQTEVTGIDDGEREKTINLLLKENKKSAIFGEGAAGIGSTDHYKLNAKAFRFTEKTQVAALGMFNNVNQFGFTFKDYLDFSGGMRGFNGDQTQFNSNSGLPVDFGDNINGQVKSGAGGFNCTYEPRKYDRFNVSYMVNGSDQYDLQKAYTENYTSANPLYTYEMNEENSNDLNHSLILLWKNRIDSVQNFNVKVNLQAESSNNSNNDISTLSQSDSITDELNNISSENSTVFSGNIKGIYIRRLNSPWSSIKANVEINYSKSLSDAAYENSFRQSQLLNTSYLRDDNLLNSQFSASFSATRKIGKFDYVEPGIEAGIADNENKRNDLTSEIVVSIYDYKNIYKWVRPFALYKWNKAKKHFVIGIKAEQLQLENKNTSETISSENYLYILPLINWENEYKKGKRYSINYQSKIVTPTIQQSIPVVDNKNIQFLTIGNPGLKPEYQHAARVNWAIFDQFSFTSLFSRLFFRYTKDNITSSKIINENLTQTITAVNGGDEFTGELSSEFSTPLKALRLLININAGENFSKSNNFINLQENRSTIFEHHAGIGLENRKKEKFDISADATFYQTVANYSINIVPSYLRSIYDFSFQFTQKKWNAGFTTSINNYSEGRNSKATIIPLLSSQATIYFAKANRISLTFQCEDVLNKNKGFERINESNYFKETSSLATGRYFLISFKYRLNKFASPEVKVDIAK
jgi:hypothetical protein